MGRQQTLKDEYFEWLCKSVELNKRRTYRKLCEELHTMKFRWTVRNDDNRCTDGIALREHYINEMFLDDTHTEVQYFLKGDCTVLEVLVAIAERINDLMYDWNHPENHKPRWFLEMIKNLELDEYSDADTPNRGYTSATLLCISKKVSRMMDRKYDFYGNGGLFPLKRKPPKDQRYVEVWYQMMAYLDENYGL